MSFYTILKIHINGNVIRALWIFVLKLSGKKILTFLRILINIYVYE